MSLLCLSVGTPLPHNYQPISVVSCFFKLLHTPGDESRSGFNGVLMSSWTLLSLSCHPIPPLTLPSWTSRRLSALRGSKRHWFDCVMMVSTAARRFCVTFHLWGWADQVRCYGVWPATSRSSVFRSHVPLPGRDSDSILLLDASRGNLLFVHVAWCKSELSTLRCDVGRRFWVARLALP